MNQEPKKKRTGQKQKRETVDIVHPSYQPSAAELREDLRINTSFDQLTDALAKEVRANYVKSPKNVRR